MFDAKFVVRGTPVPKARPRVDPRSGQIYTPTKSKKYEKRVRGEAWAASLHHRLEGALVKRQPPWPTPDDCARVRRRLRGKRPGDCSCAWCSTEFRVDLLIVLPDRRTRDLDNIEKSVLDGITGALWRDDRQVASSTKRREFNKADPRVEVTIEAVVAQAPLDIAPATEDDNPFGFGDDSPGWETGRAREFFAEHMAIVDRDVLKSELETVWGELAALLRDCWASGFLEGMDAGDGEIVTDAKLPPRPSTEELLRRAGHPKLADEYAAKRRKDKPGLRLVRPPKGPD